MQINYLAAGGAVCSGRYNGFPVTAVIEVMRSNATFLKMLGSFQKYIHVKTSVLHFNFEICSAQFIQPGKILLENLMLCIMYCYYYIKYMYILTRAL